MTLNIITHDALSPLRHGFFTRKGGVSSGIYAGLNCGPGSRDQSGAVAINRARVAAALDVDEGDLSSLHQTHSADVIHVTAPVTPPRPKADAMVTATQGQALGVLTADCQPVLFHDPKARVIGAAHAGWKGLLGGVLEATIDAMEGLGASRASITAVIGPSLSQPNYEVGPDFPAQFTQLDPAYDRFFAPGNAGRFQFDLTGLGLFRLEEAGVGQAARTGHCTYGDPSLFYSYRRSVHRGEPDYGRLIAAIVL